MKQSQAEIKAIQEKLQAIQASRSVGRTSTIASSHSTTVPDMVEMTPNRATATATRPQLSDYQSSDYQHARERHEQLAAVVAQLQQQSATYFNPVKSSQTVKSLQTQPRPASQISSKEQTQAKTQALKQLEVQAQRINELSSAQEAAMLEWKAIAEKLERDRKAVEREDGSDLSSICEYLATAVPHIERDQDGSFVLTTRSVDLFRAEHDAGAMAQTLRHRSVHSNESSSTHGALPKHRTQRPSDLESWGRVVWQQISMFIDAVKVSKAAPTLKTSRSRQKTAVQSVAVPDVSLQDAAMWVLGSVIVRVALDLFLVANPGMWLPVIALIATPAAIAVYRTTVAPQSGLVWGYRLFLIMVGLLLGGRL